MWILIYSTSNYSTIKNLEKSSYKYPAAEFKLLHAVTLEKGKVYVLISSCILLKIKLYHDLGITNFNTIQGTYRLSSLFWSVLLRKCYMA